MDAVMLPALGSFADAVSSQLRINRKKSKRKTFGFLDHWIFYSNTLFAMEVKRAYLNSKTMDVLEFVKGKKGSWAGAIDQVHSFQDNEVDFVDARKILRVALLVLNAEGKYGKGKFSPLSAKTAPRVLKDVREQLRPRPNWAAIWLLPKPLREELEGYLDIKGHHLYAALFLSRVYLKQRPSPAG